MTKIIVTIDRSRIAVANFLMGLTQVINLSLLVCLLLALSLLFSTSCFGSGHREPYSAEFYYKVGNSYYDNADMKRAEAMYLKAIKIKPRYTECYTQLGYVYYFLCEAALAQGENIQELNKYHARSYNYFQRALRYKRYARPHLGLALLYISANKFDKALGSITQAQTIESDDVITQTECHYLKGRCYNLQAKYQEALVEFKEYLKLMPVGPQAKNVRRAIRVIEKELNLKFPSLQRE